MAKVFRGTLTRFIEQPGYLKAYETTPIYTKIAGFAEEPKVDIGDKVKKDELLVKIWIPEVVTDLAVKVIWRRAGQKADGTVVNPGIRKSLQSLGGSQTLAHFGSGCVHSQVPVRRRCR